MSGMIAVRKSALLRGIVVLALGVGVAACTPSDTSRDLVYLPDTTKRIDVREARETQLRTGTYRDDYPEYTGAPDAQARRPAYVHDTRETVFRDVDTTSVPPSAYQDVSAVEVQDRQSDGPYIVEP